MSRTIVYVDGFNLYYCALKGTAHKWLNLEALCHAVLPAAANIAAINYYTAYVSGRIDPSAQHRQNRYLRALATLPLVRIHHSNFLISKKWAGLVQPPQFRPPYAVAPGAALNVAYVWKTEEKGTDVALGAHLVRDAFTNSFDEAAVITNDTDLVEPIRIVTQEVKLPVTLLTPVSKRPAQSLVSVSTHVRHIESYLGACQFPSTMTAKSGKTLLKPSGW